MFKTSKTPVTPGLRPGYDLPATEKCEIGRTMLQLIVRLVVWCHDWSVVGRNYRSHDATIERAIDRCIPRLIYDWPSGTTIDRTFGDRMPRVLVGSVTCRMPRLLVRSVAGWNDWSYHLSPAVTTDRTIGSHDWSYGRSPAVTIDRTIGRRDWSYDRPSGAITDRTSVVDRYH